MIPKIIHYCWFGKKPKSDLINKCIESWKKKLPDYQIIEWNEKTFDIKGEYSCKYVRQAYKIGKYAFVADFVRLYALYNLGGIYLDTDVEVFKSFDNFLSDPAFIGYENNKHFLGTAVIGSEKKNPLISIFLKEYKDKKFILKNGKYNLKTNVEIITNYLKLRGAQLNGSFYNFENLIYIYPKDYFFPKNNYDGMIEITNNTICIHYYNASWCRKIKKQHAWFVNLFGENIYFKLGKIKSQLLALINR